MRLKDFDYNLPKNLIAQKPISPRDRSRLLILRRTRIRADLKIGSARTEIEHKHFYDIVDYFNKGDVLVLNNTKVFPARLIGKKKETGGKIEVFLLKTSPQTPLLIRRGEKGERWRCLIGGHGRKEKMEIEFEGVNTRRGASLRAKILKDNKDGTWLVEFNKGGKRFMDVAEKIGQVPLPPYIKRGRGMINNVPADKKNYQTVYAEKIGSVAAPTAGFHFTPKLIKEIKKKGVEIVYITLHVGLGTFAPVKTEKVEEHKMHAEWFEIKKETLEKILEAKKEKKKIFAVGTTSVRTLETVFSSHISHIGHRKKIRNKQYVIRDFSGWTDIFIYPGYKFKAVDNVITNFHLPKSTLLMLVGAFAGRSKIKRAYVEAIRRKYRFFSYGDAMLII